MARKVTKKGFSKRQVKAETAVIPQQGESTGIRIKVIAVFAAVLAMHLLWSTYYGGEGAHCSVDAGVEDQCGPLEEYLETGGYWMGLSYALALTFAFFAWLRFRESRARRDENAALGGIGLSGALALLGCFIIGCCGSPSTLR